ncbi:MAG: hypothetical protein IT324_24390 [Anaerolineae bacterium]|nr:hypothetical protein [Anaerolineae bacterium]
MPNKKVSKPRSSKYEPLFQGILFVILGLIGIWLMYDASQGGRWFISTTFSRSLYEALGRNGIIVVMAIVTIGFFVGGFWTIINAVMRLTKKDTDPH